MKLADNEILEKEETYEFLAVCSLFHALSRFTFMSMVLPMAPSLIDVGRSQVGFVVKA